MKVLRKLLFPFAVLYGGITSVRNFLFDVKLFQSHEFLVPTIAVGNLSVGGTGKTPQIEYLIRLLSPKYRVATLSRGYKRKSSGFVLASATSDAKILGDEPFQLYQKFKNIQVAVDANRKNGIEQLVSQPKRPEVILLDDAYQHRAVKAGLYILLTSYKELYSKDFVLPMGNLRERRSGAVRASIVVVTKCPRDLSPAEQNRIKDSLGLTNSQQVFFTYIEYDASVYSKNRAIRVDELKGEQKILLAGVAKPAPFFEHLKQEGDVCLTFADHHDFSQTEIQTIYKQAQGKKIVTTEKDYARLKDTILSQQLYYLAIQSSFINNESTFNQTILNYVGKSSRNG